MVCLASGEARRPGSSGGSAWPIYNERGGSMGRELVLLEAAGELPAILEGSGRKARDRIAHFLRAAIDNDNTRRAYGRALASFFLFLEDGGREHLEDIGPLDVRDYLEAAKSNGLSTATLKLHMAAVRMLFDHLVTGGVLEHNPALSVRAPRHSVRKGKTPILTAEEAGELLRSIEMDTILGLRDRALIGVMVFTFARISAACGMNVGDVFHQSRRVWVRLHEKGGKFHEMPCHHTLEGYLAEYLERGGLVGNLKLPLFQAIKHRPFGRGEAELNGRRLSRVNAWQMVQRRGKAAGLSTEVCNHTFRGTGITAYLENGGTLEKARQMAAHASTRTTQLYDRREDRVTLDEVVKINIRG
jgi:site-specific recombinase XerD